MDPQEWKKILTMWVNEYWNTPDVPDDDKYVASDIEINEMSSGRRVIPSHRELIGEVQSLRRSIPDMRFDAVQMLADEEGAAAVGELRGTVLDDRLGESARGRHVAIRMSFIAQFEEDLLKRIWIFTDLTRLGGFLPAP